MRHKKLISIQDFYTVSECNMGNKVQVLGNNSNKSNLHSRRN